MSMLRANNFTVHANNMDQVGVMTDECNECIPNGTHQNKMTKAKLNINFSKPASKEMSCHYLMAQNLQEDGRIPKYSRYREG